MSGTKTQLVLFAHGSSVESANEAVREVARAMARSGGYAVQASFLEGGKPGLPAAIEAAVSDGMERVIVVPYFLTAGLHLQRDLPALVREALVRHPKLRIEVTPPLDGHPALVGILLDRAATVLTGD